MGVSVSYKIQKQLNNHALILIIILCSLSLEGDTIYIIGMIAKECYIIKYNYYIHSIIILSSLDATDLIIDDNHVFHTGLLTNTMSQYNY